MTGKIACPTGLLYSVPLWFALVLFLFILPPSAHAAEKPGVVLMPVSLHGGIAGESRTNYESAVAKSLSGRYTVYTGSKVAEVVDKVMERESSAVAEGGHCDATKCLRQIANEFQVEFIAVTDVTKNDGDYHLSLKVVDVVDEHLEFSDTISCDACRESQVLEKLKTLASSAVAPPSSSAPSEEQTPAPVQPASGANSFDVELAYWNSIKDSANVNDFAAYLKDYPVGKFVNLAKSRMATLSKPASITPPAAQVGANSFAPGGSGATKVAPTGEMVSIKGGCFDMGSDSESSNEEPVHRVCLDDFYMDKYEVTQSAYEKTMGSNPSYFKNCPDCPVELVDWNEASGYCAKVGKRLPTEAEWEYSARSGGKNEKYAGTSDGGRVGDYAWFDGNSGSKTHPVGQKQPNGLGLYDMSGNVWEWVADWYGEYKQGGERNPTGPSSESSKVLRGGSWDNRASYLRAWDCNANCVSSHFYGNRPSNSIVSWL